MLCKSDPKEENQNKGVEYSIFDVVEGEEFLMKGILLYTMHDYSGTTFGPFLQLFFPFVPKRLSQYYTKYNI